MSRRTMPTLGALSMTARSSLAGVETRGLEAATLSGMRAILDVSEAFGALRDAARP